MRKHENDEIRKHARQVYVKWKTHFVEHRDRPQIEVQCDLKTEKTRKAGRKFISEALEVTKPDWIFYLFISVSNTYNFKSKLFSVNMDMGRWDWLLIKKYVLILLSEENLPCLSESRILHCLTNVTQKLLVVILISALKKKMNNK